MKRKMLLLVNLGSPENPTPPAVGRYLKEFLMDPFVIDLPYLQRFLLVRGIIVPFRKYKSSHAYKQIWTEQGSPLVVNTQDLARAVQGRLGDGWTVEWAMRYGPFGLSKKMTQLNVQEFSEVLVLPLYPQEAKSSSGTVKATLKKQIAALGSKWKIIESFYEEPGFISAWVAQMRRHWQPQASDHVIFSFHGLPENHVKETDPTGMHCLRKEGCCEVMVDANRHCYRAQCHATARAIARQLNLPREGWSIAFQSGLGKRWIGPGLNDVIANLRGKGHHRLVVSCPSFVSDCLETLEEIGIRTKALAKDLGMDLELIPAVNDSDSWAQAVAEAAESDLWKTAVLEPDPM